MILYEIMKNIHLLGRIIHIGKPFVNKGLQEDADSSANQNEERRTKPQNSQIYYRNWKTVKNILHL